MCIRDRSDGFGFAPKADGSYQKIPQLGNVIIEDDVEIGENTVIAAQVGISGSTKIGKGVMMGGQSGTIGHIVIADGIKVAARAGITKDFKEANMTLSGYPAREQSAFLRTQVSLKNLSELEKRVKELEIMVQHLSQKG